MLSTITGNCIVQSFKSDIIVLSQHGESLVALAKCSSWMVKSLDLNQRTTTSRWYLIPSPSQWHQLSVVSFLAFLTPLWRHLTIYHRQFKLSRTRLHPSWPQFIISRRHLQLCDVTWLSIEVTRFLSTFLASFVASFSMSIASV